MNNAKRPARTPGQTRLFNLLSSEFHNPAQVFELMDDFLGRQSYDARFCERLIAIGKRRTGVPWNLRRLAVLMLEHEILKLEPGDLDSFDSLFVQLDLKAPGLDRPLTKSVLKEGYSSNDIRRFVPEFRRKLERLNRVHHRIRGKRTSNAALRDFIDISRQPCKLAVARYLFKAEDVVDEIIRQLRDTDGVRDLDPGESRFIRDEIERSVDLLPDYEAEILRRLREASRIYWVSDNTSSRLNSLVEYPLTTVVLVIKPPGSDVEFEIKRAGLRGENSLNVVSVRKGYWVPPSHRLDGGTMQWLLRFETNAATTLSRAYRLVHRTEAPVPAYTSRSSVYSIPGPGGEIRTMDYFTERHCFGPRFGQMRMAMRDCVAAFYNEGHGKLPDLPDGLGLTAQFIGQVAPAQSILSGTTSFRLDKLDAYLSNRGPEQYFKTGLGVAYTSEDARQMADTILDEVLGVYHPPEVAYKTHEQYVAAAFSLVTNRVRANETYLSLVDQIAKFWGTMLSLRMHTRGESFVARNVGLKSHWDNGEWKVKIIFMDHDAITDHCQNEHFFYADSAIPTMALDESYIWGRNPRHFPTSELGYLQRIYRIGKAVDKKGEELGRESLKEAYVKTRSALQSNQRLRSLFHKKFLSRLLDWDIFVNGYLGLNSHKDEDKRWRKKMAERLEANGYKPGAVERLGETVEKNREFLEKYSFLFEPPY